MAADDDWLEAARALLFHLFFAGVLAGHDADFADDIDGLGAHLVILGFRSRNPCLQMLP